MLEVTERSKLSKYCQKVENQFEFVTLFSITTWECIGFVMGMQYVTPDNTFQKSKDWKVTMVVWGLITVADEDKTFSEQYNHRRQDVVFL